MTRSSLRCFVLISVLVGGVVAAFAAPAAAQAGTNNTSANTTGANTSSGSTIPTGLTGSNVSSLRPAQVNRSNATNATNGSSGGGDGIDPVGGVTSTAEDAWNYATPDVPSTEQIANDTANWTEEHLLNATAGILDTANSFIVGTIHPENSGPNGIFGTPTNKPFESLYKSCCVPTI